MNHKMISRLLVMWLLGGLVVSCTGIRRNAPYRICFEGKKSVGKSPDASFIATGKNTMILGRQDLSFDDSLHELSGIWFDSLKLLDGFWMKLSDGVNNTETVLKASGMSAYPHYLEFDYDEVPTDIKVGSVLFASESKSGIVHTYTIRNRTDGHKAVNLEFIVKTNSVCPHWDGRGTKMCNRVVWNNKRETFVMEDLHGGYRFMWGSDLQVASFREGKMQIGGQENIMMPSMYSQIHLKPKEERQVTYVLVAFPYEESDIEEKYAELLNQKEKELACKKEAVWTVLETAYGGDQKNGEKRSESDYWKTIAGYWKRNIPSSMSVAVGDLGLEMLEGL